MQLKHGKVRSPLWATFDHVVPKAKGGPGTRENIRLAHFGCNVAKADEDIQGLDLVDVDCTTDV